MSKGTSTGRPRDIHTKVGALEESTEITILNYLAKHDPKNYSFRDYSKGKEAVLGSLSQHATKAQNALGVRVKNRIYYLRSNLDTTLFPLLREKGLNTFQGRDIPDKVHVNTDQEEDDINPNLCKFSVRFYSTLRLGNVKASNRHRIIGFHFSYKKLHYHNSLVLFSTNFLLFPYSILLSAQSTKSGR